MNDIQTTENISNLDLSNKNIKDADNIFEHLAKFPELEELNLKNNHLTTLPDNLSFLTSLKNLDLSNNNFIDFKKIAQSLATLPNLVDLRINLSNHEEAIEILTSLPNIIMLNGKSTKEDTNNVDIDGNEIDSVSLHNEISNFNDLYLRINERLKPLGKDALSQFFNNFQNILRVEIDKINKSVDNSIPNYIYATNVIILISMIERRDPDLVAIIKDTNSLISNANNSLTDIIFKLNPKIKETSEGMKKQFEEALKNTNYFKSKEYEEKIAFMQKEKDFLLSQAEIEKNMLKEKITQLETENKLMTDKIMRKAKSAISDSIQYDGFKNYSTNINNNNNINNSSKIISNLNNSNIINSKNNNSKLNILNNNNNNDNKNKVNKSIDLINNNNNNYSQEDLNSANQLSNDEEFQTQQKSKIQNSIVFNPISGESQLNKSKSGNVLVGPVNCRVLTKNMLLDIIQEIYDSKTNFDQKCQEQNQPKETMEQHMYTYLNHKYGLKNLIIEWASSIINGIRMFSSEDAEICLFGKILRNELEEESRFIIAKMKSTISDLLVYFLKAKFPLKISNEIKQMAEAKIAGILNEDEWQGIIYNVYEKEDADVLNGKIEEFIRKNLGIIRQNKMKKKMTREEENNLQKAKEDYRIPYADFVRILLDYQIKSRDRYLRNFCFLFRKVDTDFNGLINEEEFINLLEIICVYPLESLSEHANRLLEVIDPQNHKVISFSDCVNLFSSEYFEEIDENGNKNKINVLDKVSQEGFIL